MTEPSANLEHNIDSVLEVRKRERDQRSPRSVSSGGSVWSSVSRCICWSCASLQAASFAHKTDAPQVLSAIEEVGLTKGPLESDPAP